jgi:hypothetical protein
MREDCFGLKLGLFSMTTKIKQLQKYRSGHSFILKTLWKTGKEALKHQLCLDPEKLYSINPEEDD